MNKRDWTKAVTTEVPADVLIGTLTLMRTQSEFVRMEFREDLSVQLTARSSDNVTLVRIVTAPAILSCAPGPEAVTFRIDGWLDALKGSSEKAVIDWLPGIVRIHCGRVATTLPLEGVEDGPLRVPELALGASVMIPASALSALVARTDAKQTNAYRFTISQEGLSVDAHDTSGLGSELTIPADECTLLDGTAYAVYPWKPWANLLRALPKGAEIMIEMDDDYPCRVTMSDRGWEGLWMAAPMIEEDSI